MAIDPALEDDDEEEEEEQTPAWQTTAKGPDREGMVSDYLPEEDEWTAKTVLDLNDPARVAVLGNWGKIFPECEHHQPIIDDFLVTFMKSRTSVAGESREEYRTIFQSMFGKSPDGKKSSGLADILAADLDDD